MWFWVHASPFASIAILVRRRDWLLYGPPLGQEGFDYYRKPKYYSN